MRLADRASAALCAVVHATALLTMLGWVLMGQPARCYCSQRWRSDHHLSLRAGLAIPTWQTVRVRCHVQGWRITNSGDSIERLADVDHVIFDKTVP